MARTMRRTRDNRVVQENDAKGLKVGQVIAVDLTEELDDQAGDVSDLLRDYALWLEEKGHPVAHETAADYRSSGWFGMASEVEHYLACVGADRDEQGRFLVGGGVALGLGEQEIVIAGDAYYLAGGERKNLAAGLRSTSYGMGIAVFM